MIDPLLERIGSQHASEQNVPAEWIPPVPSLRVRDRL
jgi:hypothetical protein